LTLVIAFAIEGAALAQHRANPLRYTVAPSVPTEITMTTLPNASCALHRENDADPANQLKLYADPQGVIRFHTLPSAESEIPAAVVIDCNANGQVESYPLQLRSHSKPTSDMPSPPAGLRKALPGGAHVRPALVGDEALRLSEEELVSRGYPLRPDPDQAPDAFDAWRRAVSVPATFVEPALVARPEVTHAGRIRQGAITNGAETTGNWSGFELQKIYGSYNWVNGMWYVPYVTATPNTHAYSAFWIGLDGDGPTDLVQAGTEQEILDISTWGAHFTFSTYYAWTEFLPTQKVEQQVSGLAVHPGDTISVQVWVGDMNASPNLNGAYCIFHIQNLSNAQYTTVYTPRGSTAIDGSEAEWVMERPTVNGSLPYLANYGTVNMYSASARKADGTGFVAYQGDTNAQITMMNGSHILSTVTPLNTYTMTFRWIAGN